VQEGGSVAAGRVITQTSSDKTDYRFPLAIYQPSKHKSFYSTMELLGVRRPAFYLPLIHIQQFSKKLEYLIPYNLLNLLSSCFSGGEVLAISLSCIRLSTCSRSLAICGGVLSDIYFPSVGDEPTAVRSVRISSCLPA
jgi:hypothetical protein